MEEKKVLNDEKIEEVSGGRRYLAEKEFPGLNPADKEAILERVKKVDLKSGEIPREVLDAIAGGSCSGGELDAGDIATLFFFITLYKESGKSLDDCLRILGAAGYSNEALSFVASNW